MYSDPEIFRLQRDRVFARTWHYVGHADLIKVAGQVYPFTLLPGMLNEPLVLTRDGKDRIHCLSNVCTQKPTAEQLAQVKGETKTKASKSAKTAKK